MSKRSTALTASLLGLLLATIWACWPAPTDAPAAAPQPDTPGPPTAAQPAKVDRIALPSANGELQPEPFRRLCYPADRDRDPIEGTVVDALQQPAPGVRVWLRDWEFEHKGQKSASIVEVVTDRLGRYRFVGVPPGGKWLQLLVAEQNSSERAVEPFEVEAGKTYVHDLQVPAR